MPASARPGPATVLAQARPAAGPVLLIDGDRLTVMPVAGGRGAVSVLAAGTHDSLVSLRRGGRTDVIPADALPYLGHGLDLSLFDVSALRRAEAQGRLPVQVRFRGRRPSLPGVTFTRSGQATATGYLTVSSARAFGAALRRQFRTDHGGDSYSSGGLFAGGVDIAVAGAPTPPRPVRPDFPMRTLTVTGTDLSGRPDNGDGAWVFNADDLATVSNPLEAFKTFHHGVARFSVPAGHYWVIGEFNSYDGANGLTHVAVLPTVTVGRDTTVHVAATAATSKVTMATPRPALPLAVHFTAVLGDRHGLTQIIQWFVIPGSIWVNPTARKPAVGTLRTFAGGRLTSPPGTAGTSYVYNLDFKDPAGIIPPQHYLVKPKNLATVTERYYQDMPSTGAWLTFGGYRADVEAGVGFFVRPLPLPGVQVQYFSASPALLWRSGYFTSGGDLTGGQFDDTWRALSPGQRQVVDWNRYPLHPQPDFSTGTFGDETFPLIPSATRAGDTLTLTITPFSDNQPGHLGSAATGTPQTVRYEVDQNGVRIARGDGSNGIPPVALSKRPSVIRFTLDATRTDSAYRLPAGSQTVWTWRSAPKPDATVPPSWYCSQPSPGQFLRRCAVQSMMTLDYQVQGMTLDGTVRPGRQMIMVHVGHIQLAAGARIAAATARASCDGGKSWQRAAASAVGGANFRVTFTAPAGCAVTLRVSAADTAGSSITETITRAYKIGS